MSENRTGSSGTSQADDRSGHERDKDEFQAGTGYQPSTNQARDEPLPASHHDDGRQVTATREARRRGEPVREEPPPGQGRRGHGRPGEVSRRVALPAPEDLLRA